MAQREWNLEVFATDTGIEPFSIFADELEDFEWVALDAALRAVLAVRGLDLVRTEWLEVTRSRSSRVPNPPRCW